MATDQVVIELRMAATDLGREMKSGAWLGRDGNPPTQVFETNGF
ncbi:hypothetical protein [Pseudorhodoplanes sp.]|nr:hypothetical protein [Pseudorhodoplanes sp.]HWV54105.1 hypothetical protein [Pseudorhodoplanes sp.]